MPDKNTGVSSVLFTAQGAPQASSYESIDSMLAKDTVSE